MKSLKCKPEPICSRLSKKCVDQHIYEKVNCIKIFVFIFFNCFYKCIVLVFKIISEKEI